MKDFKNFVLENTMEDVAEYCARKAVENTLDMGCSDTMFLT